MTGTEPAPGRAKVLAVWLGVVAVLLVLVYVGLFAVQRHWVIAQAEAAISPRSE